jgi:hypothetical protein
MMIPLRSVGDADVALLESGVGEKAVLTPAPRSSSRRTLNLARPWKFPAGHADSFLCRRHSRSIVQVPVEVSLFRGDGSPYDKGTGVIRDLSYSGLCLGDVFLARGRLLATYFGVELRRALKPPGVPCIQGRILHAYSSGFPGFGIEFLFPGSGAEEELLKLS